MGKISSLPRSIAKDKTSLEKGEYAAKFIIGPTPAKPGPTLLKQEIAAERFVSIENGSKDRMKKIVRIEIIYIAK